MRTPSRFNRTVAAMALAVAVAGCAGSAASPSSAPSAQATGAPSIGPTNPASNPPAVMRWPAPADPGARATAAGLQLAPKEYGTNHVHAHLDVFVDGVPIIVPAGIGIDITNPDVKTFDDAGGKAYGGISMCAVPCISPLHTHDASGVLHTESRTQAANTLGEFFVEWGVPLTASCLADLCDKSLTVYVDGKPYTGDPNAIPLTDQREIAVVVGTPPPQIPATGDFSKA